MWSPLRARRLASDGCLQPFVPFETFGDPRTLNCDRDSQGSVYFADMGLSVVRPRCLDNLEQGLLPQKWMGRKIFPLKQWGGCDVDYEWQIPLVEHCPDLGVRRVSLNFAMFRDALERGSRIGAGPMGLFAADAGMPAPPDRRS